jgi:hypothetical protein
VEPGFEGGMALNKDFLALNKFIQGDSLSNGIGLSVGSLMTQENH